MLAEPEPTPTPTPEPEPKPEPKSKPVARARLDMLREDARERALRVLLRHEQVLERHLEPAQRSGHALAPPPRCRLAAAAALSAAVAAVAASTSTFAAAASISATVTAAAGRAAMPMGRALPPGSRPTRQVRLLDSARSLRLCAAPAAPAAHWRVWRPALLDVQRRALQLPGRRRLHARRRCLRRAPVRSASVSVPVRCGVMLHEARHQHEHQRPRVHTHDWPPQQCCQRSVRLGVGAVVCSRQLGPGRADCRRRVRDASRGRARFT